MQGRITLITPPDFFENSNESILFCNLDQTQQDKISKWLTEKEIKTDLNLYVYTNETDLPWIFYAFGRCDYRYINLDNANDVTKALAGYLISRNNTYYSTQDTNLAAIYSHISNNRINQIETFLERVLID